MYHKVPQRPRQLSLRTEGYGKRPICGRLVSIGAIRSFPSIAVQAASVAKALDKGRRGLCNAAIIGRASAI